MSNWNLTMVGDDEGLLASLQASVPDAQTVVCLRQDSGWLVLSENRSEDHTVRAEPKEHAGGGATSSAHVVAAGSSPSAKGKS